MPAASDVSPADSNPRGLRFGDPEAADFNRSFLVVIDDESLPQGSEQSTRDALRVFLRRLDSRDRVGLVTVPHGGLRVPLTTDRSGVLGALQRIVGRASGRESATDAACRTRGVLRELNALMLAAARSSGPTVVVLFSGSMYDGGGAVQAPFGTFITCDLQLGEFRPVGVSAAQSRSYL